MGLCHDPKETKTKLIATIYQLSLGLIKKETHFRFLRNIFQTFVMRCCTGHA